MAFSSNNPGFDNWVNQYSGTPQGSIDVQGYLAARPDLTANYQNNPGLAQVYGSLDNYATDDYFRASNGPQRYSQFQKTADTNPTDAATSIATSDGVQLPGSSYTPPADTVTGTGTGTTGTTGTTGNSSPAQLTPPPPASVATTGPTNFNNTQNANQFGQYQNDSNTVGIQQGTSGSTTQGTNASTTNTAGTSGSSTTGQNDSNTSTSGTTTSTPLDTLGFGALLQGQAGLASADDATRRAFLTDLVNTGGSAEASQLDQGIRNSLTGAQMTGAGDSARARAAGYAAAQVSRNNTDQRLSAAGQLAGPTAVEGLSTAANPFIGSSTTQNSNSATHGTNSSNTSGFDNSTSNTAGTNSSNTTGFSNLVSAQNETGSGTATGSSSQAAAGLAPSTQTTTPSGGCVLCTAAIELGLSKHHRVLRTVISHKLSKDWPRFRLAARGYFFLFTPLARVLLGHPHVARVLWPLAKAVVYEELRVAGRQLPPRMWARFVHWSGHYLCAFVGRFPVPGQVTDPVILGIAQREGILFEVQS